MVGVASTEPVAIEANDWIGLSDAFDDSGRSCVADPGKYCDPWVLQPPRQLLPKDSVLRSPDAKQVALDAGYSLAK
jgi:hypothetical protein